MRSKKFAIGQFDIDEITGNNNGIDTLYIYSRIVAKGLVDYKKIPRSFRLGLLAELHQTTLDGNKPVYEDTSPFLRELYSNGFIAYMEALAGFRKVHWVRKVYIPPRIPLQEQTNIKTRIVTAGYEGMLFGLNSFNPEIKKDLSGEKRLLSFFTHLAYWVKEYAKIEAEIICGERSGSIILAEMNKEKRKSRGERKRRKILRMVKNMPQYVSYENLLQHFKDKGNYDINIKDINAALGDNANTTISIDENTLPFQNKYSGSILSYETLDHVYMLEHIRKELLFALVNNIGEDSNKIAFTSELARAMDIFYFGALPLKDDVYEDSDSIFHYKSLISQLKYLRSFNNENISLVIKSRIACLEEKIETIRKTLLLRIPEVDTSLFNIGMLQYPFKLLDSCGENNVSKIAHIRIKNNRIDIASLNLAVRRLAAILNSPVTYYYVNQKCFDEAKQDIIFLKGIIEQRGYFNIKSRNVLPSIEESYKLSTGYVPTQIRDIDNGPFYINIFGEKKPMLCWVKC